MYTLILILLFGLALYLFLTGLMQKKTARLSAGIIMALLTAFFFWFMDFWGEMLWFSSVGQEQRFWTEILARLLFLAAGGVIGWLFVFMMTGFIPKENKYVRLIARSVGTLIGAAVSVFNWDLILRYFNRVSTSLHDPVLQKETGFYLFSLPFYDLMYELFFLLSLISLVACLGIIFIRNKDHGVELDYTGIGDKISDKTFRAMYINGAVFIFILAAGKYLARFHLLYSQWGAVNGPSWTDVHIRLPAYAITIVLTLAIGLFLLIPRFRGRLENMFIKSSKSGSGTQPVTLFSAAIFMFLIWLIIQTIIPGLFQWIRVEPNEITFEKPYIKNNIKFTRHGFNLNNVEEREFPAKEEFTEEMVAKNKNLFSNIRLWDYRALDAVYKQFQEIRLYYQFVDVDIDRYDINDSYRQVMVSAREIELSNLPQQSQTFVNKRFKYTHGYGITLTTVSEFSRQGLPNLLIKDIPPKSEYASLHVDRPEIYYGELTNTHVIVNSKEEEFDYPSGEENIYVQYSGIGGVQISNLWRKFLFGWKFDGTRFLFSGYPTEESRIMFHRQIKERAHRIAPFLEYDDDPYIVLNDGKLYWIIDAYTTSKYFPYSEPFLSKEFIEYKQGEDTRLLTTDVGYNLNGINYIRNSVKVIVDVYNGNVDYYIFDKDDPLIQVWSEIFPGLFKNKDEMPSGLMKHVRYPADLLLVQGLVYAKYHMNDPAVFYNQEDLWIRATEKYYDRVQPVEPYYIMWELPDSDEPEYALILPFTPKNRQVMIGWIAGMCDGENYGRFLAYKFPKEKRILGPQQVETKIDQDSFLSGQLSLWDQRGSNVIRGNVLAIPIDETLLYVEPIYLQAETAAYPELRLVAVMHGDNLSYAETFDQALKGIFEEQAEAAPQITTGLVSRDDLIQSANDAFQNYLRFLGEKNYKAAANALENLEASLQKLSENSNEN